MEMLGWLRDKVLDRFSSRRRGAGREAAAPEAPNTTGRKRANPLIGDGMTMSEGQAGRQGVGAAAPSTVPRLGRPAKVARRRAGDVGVTIMSAGKERLAPRRAFARSRFYPLAPPPSPSAMTVTPPSFQRRTRLPRYEENYLPGGSFRPVASGSRPLPPPPPPPPVSPSGGSDRWSGAAGSRTGEALPGSVWGTMRGSGIGGTVGGGFGSGFPKGRKYGVVTTPQTSPRRRITGITDTARTPPPRGGRRSWGGNGAVGGGSVGSRSARTNRLFRFSDGSSRSVLQPLGFSSPRRRGEGRAAWGDGGAQGGPAAAAAACGRDAPNMAAAVRSLGVLRSKARTKLERDASAIAVENPRGAEQLYRDARNIENWGREANEGARQAAALEATKRREALVAQEAERAATMKRVAAAAARAAEEARAIEAEEKRAREAEVELARVRAEEEARRVAAVLAEAELKKERQAKERKTLNAEEKEQVKRAWHWSGSEDDLKVVMVKAFNDTVTKKSMRTLCHKVWLGDEVINIYMKSLQARNRAAVAAGMQVPKCGIMSSFFYTQLSDSGKGYRYQGVKRFLKKAKLDLFDLDKFIFPVNINEDHWALAVINFRLKRLEYYDSLGGSFAGFEYMARFVDDESQSKRGGQRMDVSDWPRFNYSSVPQQKNGVDCGVFASMFADRLSKGRPLDFSQRDINHFREVMTLAILRGERSPTEAEAFIEDGGGYPDGFAWWEGDLDDGGMGDDGMSSDGEDDDDQDEEEYGEEEEEDDEDDQDYDEQGHNTGDQHGVPEEHVHNGGHQWMGSFSTHHQDGNQVSDLTSPPMTSEGVDAHSWGSWGAPQRAAPSPVFSEWPKHHANGL